MNTTIPIAVTICYCIFVVYGKGRTDESGVTEEKMVYRLLVFSLLNIPVMTWFAWYVVNH